MGKTRENAAALEAFTSAKAEIDTLLARLAALSEDHFGLGPDEVRWGHVTALADYRGKLAEIAAMACKEGEYA